MKLAFAALVSHSVAATRQLFKFSFQFGNALGIGPKPSARPCLVKRVVEELH